MLPVYEQIIICFVHYYQIAIAESAGQKSSSVPAAKECFKFLRK